MTQHEVTQHEVNQYVDWLVSVALNKDEAYPVRDQIEALRILVDGGWGRHVSGDVKQTIDAKGQ